MMSEPDDRYSTSMAAANVYGLVLGAIGVAALVAVHWAVWGWDETRMAARDFFDNPFVWIPAAAAALVVHEGLHGLFWGWLGGGGRSSIRYGFQWKTMTPFAHCKVPIQAGAYRIGTAAPGLIVGVLPALAGTFAGWGWLAGFGWFMTLVAGGDALVLVLIRSLEGSRLVEDHPVRAGCVVRTEAAIAGARDAAGLEPVKTASNDLKA